MTIFLGGLAVLGLLGGGAFLLRRWVSDRRSESHGADRAHLEMAAAGEAAQEAEDAEYRRRRGGLLDRLRALRK